MAGQKTGQVGQTANGNAYLHAYGVALLSVALALGITLLLLPWLYPTTTPLFFVAVMISAWHGGWWPGLLATALSMLAINYFFTEPLHSLHVLDLETVVQLSTFLIAAGLISYLNQSRHRALRSARSNLQALQNAMSREQAALTEAQTAKEQAEMVLASINDGFYVLDCDWRFTYVNHRYCEMVGMPPAKLLEQNIWELFPDAIHTEAYGHFHQAMGEQQPQHFDYYYKPWNCWHTHRVYPSPTHLTVLIADISDQKQTEAALQTSKEQLRLASEGGNFGLWYWDIQTDTLTWTEHAKVMFGLPIDTVMSMQVFQEAIHPDDRAFVHRIVSELQANQPHTEIEYRTLWADGTVRWILARGDCDYNAEGRLIATMGVMIDITERKQAEDERQQAEEDLRQSQAIAQRQLLEIEAIYQTAPIGLLVLDANLRFQRINQKLAEINGIAVEDHIGRTVREIVPDLADKVEPSFRQILATGIPLLNMEISGETKAQPGVYRTWLENWYPLKDANGQTIGISAVVQEITERKQAEAEREQILQREQVLRQQAESAEAKLQQILTSLREDFVLFNHDWQITYLNDQAADTMRLPRQDILGQTIWQIFPNLVGTDFYDQLHQVMHNRTPVQFEYFYSTWERWFENRVYPTPDGIVNLCSDITERKRAELNAQFLNQLEAELRQLTSAEAMVAKTASRLGEFLQVDQSLWSVIDQERGLATIQQDWQRPGISSLVGVHHISDFVLPDLVERYQAGQSAAVSDVTTYPYTAPFADHLHSLSIRAFIAVPCLYEGRWVALLSVNSATVRNWRADEVALLQEIVARLWSLIEHTRAVEELHQSEAELRLLADAMPQIVYISNADGVLEFVNDRWTAYTHLNLEQSRDPALVRQMIPDEDYQQLQTDFAEARATRSTYQSQFRLIQSDGRYLYFLTRAIPLLNPQGQVRKWYGTSTDITELKQLEAELRQKNAILDIVNESAPTPIFVKDRQGRVIYANPATLAAVGKSAAEVIGYRDCDFYPNPEEAVQVMANDQRIMASGQMEVVEESPDGIHIFLGMKVPYRNEAGEVIGLIGISNDITERVQLERDRERLLRQEQTAREAAEHANRIKDEFLAVVSHELRTPLNPILGWARLLRQGRLTPAKSTDAVATIERNAQLQAQLIDDLLDISRILRGKLSLNILPINLKTVISAALDTVRLAAEAKSLSFEIAMPSQTITVMGDAGRLQQVVWNLLSNAVKFTPQGGRITVTLTQSELQSGTQAQITVTDTGKGITSDFLPYVFEHFRQEDGATTRKFGGLGLGLAIVRQIVELHGGTVGAESLGEGQGATFTVRLPLASQMPAPEPVVSSADNLSGIHILIVDDQQDSREFVRFILEQAGAIVTSVASGVEALQAIEQAVPDLMISDIGMPDMDGYMLMRQIQSVSQIPAIALTAYAGEFDRQQALEAGFQQHLAKPIEPTELISHVVRLWAGATE